MLCVQKQLSGPSKETLDVCCQFTAWLQQIDIKATIMREIYVVKGLTKPLLGRPAITALHLRSFICGSIQLQEVMEKLPTLFTGLDRLKDSCCIKLKEGAQPFALSVNCYPNQKYPSCKKSCSQDLKKGVIKKM